MSFIYYKLHLLVRITTELGECCANLRQRIVGCHNLYKLMGLEVLGDLLKESIIGLTM